MYIPTHHRFDDRAAQLDLIDAHPLGTWICLGADGLTAQSPSWVSGLRAPRPHAQWLHWCSTH
ncbi:FMN-binding negative transcriptional regulator [Hydrogenophaga flava]|uniref:FMN-binding negative transcriptional regulator n=1 Tax=Hydrogenophaga flava TaxID=65657 RepID=UPI0008258363|nr:FMN-binding negative transcriptional regulator [Hydrogenophaga flava]